MLTEQMFSEIHGFSHKFVLLESAWFLSPEVWIMGHYCVWVFVSVLCWKTLVTTKNQACFSILSDLKVQFAFQGPCLNISWKQLQLWLLPRLMLNTSSVQWSWTECFTWFTLLCCACWYLMQRMTKAPRSKVTFYRSNNLKTGVFLLCFHQEMSVYKNRSFPVLCRSPHYSVHSCCFVVADESCIWDKRIWHLFLIRASFSTSSLFRNL